MKSRFMFAMVVLALAAVPAWAQESLGIGRKLVPPGMARSEPGPKGTVYELTIPKQGIMISDGVFECWVPDGAETIRCVIVHLHGCTRERDAKPLMSDLQWKTLAKKLACGLHVPELQHGNGQPDV